MAAIAEAYNVSEVSDAAPRQPRKPGRFVLQPLSSNLLGSPSRSDEEDVNPIVEALSQDEDDDVAEMEKALGRQTRPSLKALPRPSKATDAEREGGK
eukprot:381486-Amphidinium_carterae.1